VRYTIARICGLAVRAGAGVWLRTGLTEISSDVLKAVWRIRGMFAMMHFTNPHLR